MSDQADSLRQLVSAQCQWREHALRDQRADVSSPRLPDASMPTRGNQDDRPRIRGNGIGVFMARAARWAFARSGVHAE
jgi:hypothetical protein